MIIDPLSRDFLSSLYKMRLINIRQASMLFSILGGSATNRTIYRRLRGLCENKWLNKRSSAYGCIWEISASGADVVASSEEISIRKMDSLSDLSIAHQLDLNRLYLDYLSKKLPGKWCLCPVIPFQDNGLRHVRPDGLIRVGEESYAIELDRSTEPLTSNHERRTIQRKIDAYKMITTRGPREGITWYEDITGLKLTGLIFVLSVRDKQNRRIRAIEQNAQKTLKNLRSWTIYINDIERLREILGGGDGKEPVDEDWALMRDLYVQASNIVQTMQPEAVPPRLRVILNRSRETIARRMFA